MLGLFIIISISYSAIKKELQGDVRGGHMGIFSNRESTHLLFHVRNICASLMGQPHSRQYSTMMHKTMILVFMELTHYWAKIYNKERKKDHMVRVLC